MKTLLPQFLLLVPVSLVMTSVVVQDCEAQLLNALRGDGGGDIQGQYSPSDPLTRRRLFNLQTGHAGAFYNCEGEEDKRNSPYICWKNGPCGEKLHRPIWDVLDWRRDKSEIAQRICDGAGACCNGPACHNSRGAVILTAERCGCSECLAMKSQSSKLNGGSRNAMARSNRPNDATIGLIAKSDSLSPDLEFESGKAKACDCASAPAKRADAFAQVEKAAVEPANESVNEEPVARSRTASLLDRVRSSRKQR